jgi:hypothetical protein
MLKNAQVNQGAQNLRVHKSRDDIKQRNPFSPRDAAKNRGARRPSLKPA